MSPEVEEIISLVEAFLEVEVVLQVVEVEEVDRILYKIRYNQPNLTIR